MLQSRDEVEELVRQARESGPAQTPLCADEDLKDEEIENEV